MGFDVLNRIAQPQDRIHSLSLYRENKEADFVKEKVNQKLQELGMKVENSFKKYTFTTQFGEELLKHINENESVSFDFLVIGKQGWNHEGVQAELLGSTASFILQKCLINFIVV